MSEAHRRIVDLYTSTPYRWADAKQIRDDLTREANLPVMLNSGCADQINKLASIAKDLRDTLALIHECQRMVEKRYNHETARTIDVLANQEQPHAGV